MSQLLFHRTTHDPISGKYLHDDGVVRVMLRDAQAGHPDFDMGYLHLLDGAMSVGDVVRQAESYNAQFNGPWDAQYATDFLTVFRSLRILVDLGLVGVRFPEAGEDE